MSFNSEKFPDPPADEFASWNRMQVIARVARLFFNPNACAGRILVFEPTIRVCHGYTVQDFSDWFLFREGRKVQTRVHSRLRFSRASASRFMRRTKARK